MSSLLTYANRHMIITIWVVGSVFGIFFNDSGLDNIFFWLERIWCRRRRYASWLFVSGLLSFVNCVRPPPHSLSELATSLLFCMISNPTHPHVPVIYWCHLGLILLLHCLIWMHLNILNLFSNVCKWYAHSLFSLGFKIFVSISVHDMGLACLGLCCFDFIRPLPFWFMCAAGSCSVFG